MSDALKNLGDYIKTPKFYIDILMLSGGALFWVFLKYSSDVISNYFSTFINDPFFSGTEQTILFVIVSYFIGALILKFSDFLTKLPFYIFSPKKTLKRMINLLKDFLNYEFEEMHVVHKKDYALHDAELEDFINKHENLKADFSQSERFLIISKYSLFFTLFFGVVTQYKFLLILFGIFYILSFYQFLLILEKRIDIVEFILKLKRDKNS